MPQDKNARDIGEDWITLNMCVTEGLVLGDMDKYKQAITANKMYPEHLDYYNKGLAVQLDYGDIVSDLIALGAMEGLDIVELGMMAVNHGASTSLSALVCGCDMPSGSLNSLMALAMLQHSDKCIGVLRKAMP